MKKLVLILFALVEKKGQVLPRAFAYSTLTLMARPLRIEFAGALYHITSRGDKKAAIYLDDGDSKEKGTP